MQDLDGYAGAGTTFYQITQLGPRLKLKGTEMKIVVIGATGLIGKEIVKVFSPGHEVVAAGHKSGDPRVDILSEASIEDLFKKVGKFDALVSAAGQAKGGNMEDLTADDYMVGVMDKLMGQVNLVRIGMKYINDNGSFTLTSGVLADEPIPGTSSFSMVNAAVNGFGRAVALETTRGIRINVVSPPFATETLQALGMDPSTGIPAAKFVGAYKESVEGRRNGTVLDVRMFA